MAYFHLKNLSVSFPLYQGGSRSLKKTILSSSSRGNLAKDAAQRVTVNALQDLTFSITKGDRVGLIGPNGSGKTTLLRVLASIYEPTTGYFATSGRVSALLDVMAGMTPDITARENVLLRGMYMGISPKEMVRYTDEIEEFAELGGYMDMPVRTYSAGMVIRLAFAAATCRVPEILLMDEWLAAGDAHFMAKAQERLTNHVEQSSILVLASHSLELLKKWCNRGLYIKYGKLIHYGDIDEVIALYEADTQEA